MPKVSLYESRVQPERAAPTPIRAADFSANVGPALQAAGTMLAHEAEARAKAVEQQRDVDRFRHTAEGLELTQQVGAGVIGLRENLPDGGEGHVERVREMIDGMTTPFLERIQDPILRREFTNRIASLRTSTMTDEQGFVYTERQRSMGANYNRSRNAGAGLIEQSFRNVDQADGQMQDMISSLSGIPEGRRTELRDDWVRSRDTAAANSLTRENPDAAITALEGGTLGATLPPGELRGLIDRAHSAKRVLEADQRRVQAAAQSQARATIDTLQRRINDHDPTITDADLAQAQQLAQAAGLPNDVYDVGRARVQHEADRLYANATAIEIREEIGRLNTQIGQAGTSAPPEAVIRRDHLQSLLQRRDQEINNDPALIAERQGFRVTPLDGSARAIASRVSEMAEVHRRTGTRHYYRPQEAAARRQQIATGPAGRLAVMEEVAVVGRVDFNMALAAAEQVAPRDAVFRHAIRLAPNVRELAVRGADARNLLPSQVARPDGTKASFDAVTQSWFGTYVSPAMVGFDPAFATGVLETARNIYAERRRQLGATGQEEFSEANFGSAVSLALGQTSRGGGTGYWNGRGVILPTRLNQAQFERRLANIPLAHRRESWPPGAIPNGDPRWANGALVSTGDVRARFTPVAVDDGVYEFHSGAQVLGSSSGRPFRLNVYALPSAPRRSPQGTAPPPPPPSPPRPSPRASGAAIAGPLPPGPHPTWRAAPPRRP